MERRFIVFIVSCIVTIVLFEIWLPKLYPPLRKSQQNSTVQDTQTPEAGKESAPSTANTVKPDTQVSSPKKTAKQETIPEKSVKVSTDKLEMELSNQGARITSWKLLAFREKQKDPEPVELVPAANAGGLAPVHGALDVDHGALDTVNWKLETEEPAARPDGGQDVVFSTTLPDKGLAIRKTFQFSPGQFMVKVKIELENKGSQPVSLDNVGLEWGPGIGQANPDDRSNFTNAVVLTDSSIERPGLSNVDDVKGFGGKPKWIAMRNHYFTVACIPGDGPWNSAQVRHWADRSISNVVVAPKSMTEVLSASLSLKPGETQVLSASLFGGPQDYGMLKSFGVNLQKIVNFGWFEVFALPMLYVLKWFYAVTHNYGLAIILLTILVKAVVWFPTHKQMTSMRHMQKSMAQMQPRMDTIKKLYKDDPAKLNSETMKLYKEYGVNPAAGCLPMLIMMPILFALYSCLGAAFELRGAGFFGPWKDLSVSDPTLILPLAMGLSMFIQQKMTPVAASATPEQAQQQKMMQYLMPVMLTVFAMGTMWLPKGLPLIPVFPGWPAGLLLYWTSSNLLSMVQQYYINRTVN